jgi:hypothetical protein
MKSTWRNAPIVVAAAGLLGCWISVASAEVVRVQVDRREPFADGHEFGTSGPYERLSGRLFLEVEPDHPANQRIIDLGLAPRNERGGSSSGATSIC